MLNIGLFGIRGSSNWRDSFIKRYEELGISFFDTHEMELQPKREPELAAVDAQHLAEDEIILFPVTNDECANGLLAEGGFSILNAIKLNDRRSFVVMIQMNDISRWPTDPVENRKSLCARALVLEHLRKLRLSNLYVVETFEEMLEVSIILYRAAEMILPLERFNLHNIPRK